MELIYWYVIGCVIIATMSVVDLYHPVMSKHEMPKDMRIIYYVVWFLIALLVAPVLAYPCFSSVKGIEFRNALEDGLFEKD